MGAAALRPGPSSSPPSVAGAAVALSACSGAADGQSLARQACVHVHRSVNDYLLATKAGTSPSAVAHLQDEADQELRAALPLAAAANSDDGSWNSLMTTISEGAIVDEAHLIPSLTGAVCRCRRQHERQPGSAGVGQLVQLRRFAHLGWLGRRRHHRPSERQPRAGVTRRVASPGSWPAIWARPAATMVGISEGATKTPPCGVKCTPSSTVRISHALHRGGVAAAGTCCLVEVGHRDGVRMFGGDLAEEPVIGVTPSWTVLGPQGTVRLLSLVGARSRQEHHRDPGRVRHCGRLLQLRLHVGGEFRLEDVRHRALVEAVDDFPAPCPLDDDVRMDLGDLLGPLGRPWDGFVRGSGLARAVRRRPARRCPTGPDR